MTLAGLACNVTAHENGDITYEILDRNIDGEEIIYVIEDSTGEKEEILIPDIISSSEVSATKSEIPFLEDEEEGVEYTKYKETPFGVEKPKGAFSLFYDEEEEEEDEDTQKYKGGEVNDSGSSISSDKSSVSLPSPTSDVNVSNEILPDISSPLQEITKVFDTGSIK